MLNRCIQERRPFGVALIRQGQEALGPLALPHEVGCSAQVLHVKRLDDGRMNIAVVGQERFRIRSLDFASQPYLVGVVEPAPLPFRGLDELERSAERLRRQVERYIERLLSAGGAFDLRQLPARPIELAYAALGLLQISNDEKQRLLELDDPHRLLDQAQAIYRREHSLLSALLQHTDQASGISFSVN